MAPRVSVVIPTRDRLEMLQQAVSSVIEQTLREWELIVVDDGSRDDTWSWLQRQRELRAIRSPTARGPAAARNLGAAQASAPLLAFLDSDDLFLPTKLERQLALLDEQPRCALCHSDEIWLRGGRELRQRPKHAKRGGWIFAHCLPMCRISPSAAVIRRDVFTALGGFDEELEIAEDYELWLRLTCRHEVAFVPERLVVKRGGHGDQLSSKYDQIEVFRIEALRRVLRHASLTDDQRAQARAELRRKCEIYARGCEKRGRVEEAARYHALPEL
jgi:glycosyltransferase involved in cell wall biosynthesis